jgi:antitoxin ParD1/3/4
MQSLPPDLEQFVLDQLAAGRYQTSSEVLCDAVRLLRDRENRRDEVQKEIDRGLAELESGQSTELNSDAELRAFFDDIETRSQQRLSIKRDGH